nr:hypothetical protein [Tanacetum cinerariifolium]
MVAILEKGEHNSNFHPMVDFLEASPLRIETIEDGTNILATVDGIVRTVSESSLDGEHNSNFHPMVDFLEASPLRIETIEDGTNILATVDGIVRTVSESSLDERVKVLEDREGIAATRSRDDAPINGRSMDDVM